jgi:predicted DNA-binding transcriptional regulator AlpA
VSEIERMLNSRELGELLALSASTVIDRFEAGDLPGFRLFGGTDKLGRPTGPVRFRESEILATVEGWRVGPKPLTGTHPVAYDPDDRSMGGHRANGPAPDTEV